MGGVRNRDNPRSPAHPVERRGFAPRSRRCKRRVLPGWTIAPTTSSERESNPHTRVWKTRPRPSRSLHMKSNSASEGNRYRWDVVPGAADGGAPAEQPELSDPLVGTFARQRRASGASEGNRTRSHLIDSQAASPDAYGGKMGSRGRSCFEPRTSGHRSTNQVEPTGVEPATF